MLRRASRYRIANSGRFFLHSKNSLEIESDRGRIETFRRTAHRT